MTNQSTNLDKLLKKLTKNITFYYIEQKSIASKEEVDGHFVYSRFKKIESAIDDITLLQHIKKEINLAISVKNSNFLIFEYSGSEAFAFGALLYKLASFEDIKDIEIISYSDDKLVILLEPNIQDKLELNRLAKELSNKIELRVPISWRILPTDSKPDNGNLLILPREYIESPW